MLGEEGARKKLVVFFLVEPGAFDIEELQARHADGECERIDCKLRDRFIRARIGFVIEDVNGIVSDLQKVEVTGDAARSCSIARCKLNAVSGFEFADLVFGEPDRNFHRDGARVVREHKILQRLVTQFVVADGRDDERGRFCRGVLFAIDEMRAGSANAGCACDARAFGSSSRQNSSCGHEDGMFSKKDASASKR